MSMAACIGKKLLSMIPLALIVSIILFGLINLLPGNAAMAILGDSGNLEQVEQLEAKLGLDQPVYIQYINWLKGVCTGDLGTSVLTGQPVIDRIAERMPVTFELIVLSVVFAAAVGVPLGIICAVRRNRASDYILSSVSIIGVAMPAFWVGMLLIMLFSIKLHWLPASGYTPFFENPVENLRSMALPVFATGIALAATIVRQTRSAVLDVLGQDYMMTAKSKGVRYRTQLWRHALKNALIPVITAISMQIAGMIGGSVVIETVFLLPGMGKSMVDAIFQRDYPIVMGEALVIAVFIILLNTLVDVIYIFVDPRISRSGKKGR